MERKGERGRAREHFLFNQSEKETDRRTEREIERERERELRKEWMCCSPEKHICHNLQDAS